jgi:hypothetical protein
MNDGSCPLPSLALIRRLRLDDWNVCRMERAQMMDTIDFQRQSDVEAKVRRPLTELEKFGVKLALVLAAALIFFYAVAGYIQSRIESITLFKGGPAFWAQVEKKLHSLADEPDLPDQKKAEIIAIVKKLSSKYRPYIDALSPSDR